MLYDRLGIWSVLFEIGEANPVYPRRMTACPSAPDQTGYIKQQWRVVGQAYPDQRTVLRTVATGRIEEATIFTKRWRSDSREFATYMTSPSRILNR